MNVPAASTAITQQSTALYSSLSSLPPSTDDNQHPQNPRIRNILSKLTIPNPTAATLLDAISALQENAAKSTNLSATTQSSTEYAQAQEEERVAIARCVLGTYTHVMHELLQEAMEADVEADWWQNVQRSRMSVGAYFLQTLPYRVYQLSNAVVRNIRTNNLAAFNQAGFGLRNISGLFPRPSVLLQSAFPHLNQSQGARPFSFGFHFQLHSPFALTRAECESRKLALREKRDRCAKDLGLLYEIAGSLQGLRNGSGEDAGDVQGQLAELVYGLQEILSSPNADFQQRQKLFSGQPTHALLFPIQDLLLTFLPAYRLSHANEIKYLQRPSRLTRAWPRLLLAPPLAFFALRYAARIPVRDILETIQGFWQGWVVEPVAGILKTVRAGGEGEVGIVSPEGLKSDLDSLERMVLALGKEKLSMSQAELTSLAEQVRLGDLTAVQKLYEEDLKTPLKSAVKGSLVRSLLIQVQKTKVDVDLALTGIDKLLRSQELTFGFVGVAPSLAVLYALVGWFANVWRSGQGQGRYGGANRRLAAFEAMRRIERLLNTSHEPADPEDSDISPLTQGLLLLSLTHLRWYAETHLPPRTRLRDGFLEDVADLEDAGLGREEKRRVVERMWRCWGERLGWGREAEVTSLW
ncbi:hypothetical protein BOTBODRAFT_166019 [Botryobasidium botryosum FD-172 SS1]|uniref:NCA2-domain-containing protein n=1 Tax=Botryobasidium botryosum (strain FD-172 SS1) TaxID=930990 RepID=A0A067LY65_BOTB1|nr:hypothetical protein BOTBODRAFT_166019 [Botryobasidium botryosum FD-172 SS1]